MQLNEIEKLHRLFIEYLQSLDDESEDECYDTKRGVAKGAFEEFMQWLISESSECGNLRTKENNLLKAIRRENWKEFYSSFDSTE